jgi:hypothetical protein
MWFARRRQVAFRDNGELSKRNLVELIQQKSPITAALLHATRK